MRLVFACCAIALVVAVAGCGKGAPLTGPAFTVQANGICRTLTEQEAADPKTDPASTFDNIFAHLKEAVGKLDKLNPPDYKRAAFKDMMTHFHSMVDFLGKNKAFLVTLTIHLQEHPQDTGSRDRFETFIKPFDDDATAAKADAHTLVLPACEEGLGSKSD